MELFSKLKPYLETTEAEKEELITFFKLKTLDELKSKFEIKTYGFGEGVYFCFEETCVMGAICIVTETLESLHTSYLHQIVIKEGIEDPESVLNQLIGKAMEFLKNKECEKVFLGTREEQQAELFKKAGFRIDYQALKLKLKERKTSGELLTLIPLDQDNKELYLSVINQSFQDMPHGMHFEMEDIERFIEDNSAQNNVITEQKNPEQYTDKNTTEDGQILPAHDNKKSREEDYLAVYQKEAIGFVNIELEEESGSFDIGLCKKYRGRGYGKLLLETAIDLLNRKETKDIIITVIETNKIAYTMYKKRGFETDSVLSYWCCLK